MSSKPRIIFDVRCSTAANWRWLKLMMARTGCASIVDAGVAVLNETKWSELLAAAEGYEVES